jgi:hypothetical protein
MQQRSEETRMKSLASAGRLFSSVDLARPASMRSLQRRESVKARSTIILRASRHSSLPCWMDGWLQAIDNAIEASREKTAPETFMQMTEAFPYISESACEGLPMFLEFWLQASRDKTIWEASIAPYRRYHKYFTSLIKKGVEERSFVEIDPELASRMIVSTAMGLFLQSLLDPQGVNWEKVAWESTNLLVNSLLNTSKEKRIRK